MSTLSLQAKWRLCLGCGMCRFLARNDDLQLIDIPNEGIRPFIDTHSPALDVYFQACPVSPGTQQAHPRAYGDYERDLEIAFGPVLSILEGHAADPQIRHHGSSGGVLTALSLYCLERLGMHGVLHTGQDPACPVRNRTRLSRTRDELMAATGSRYSPASVCERLDLVLAAPEPCAFIGRPVEVAALRKAQGYLPELERKVGLVLSFFCAETPSSQGTIELLKSMNVDPEQVEGLTYRGDGWPGHFAARLKGQDFATARMTYRESWSFLQAYRPWSAHLWPDGTGELADISCGDPWYEQPDGINPGSSLVVVRTLKGRAIVQGAMDDGYLSLKPAEPWKLFKSQQGLASKKGAVWGRLLVMRMFGISAPRYEGYHLFENWRQLPLMEKLRSTFGTARRIITRGYWRPMSFPPVSVPRSLPYPR